MAFQAVKALVEDSALTSPVNRDMVPLTIVLYISIVISMMVGAGIPAAVLVWASSHAVFYANALLEERINPEPYSFGRWLWLTFKDVFNLKTGNWGFILLDILLFPTVIWQVTIYAQLYHASLPWFVAVVNLVIGALGGIGFHLNDTKVYITADPNTNYLEHVWSRTKRGHDLITVTVIVAVLLDCVWLLVQHLTPFLALIPITLVVYGFVEFYLDNVWRPRRRASGSMLPWRHRRSNKKTGVAVRRYA